MECPIPVGLHAELFVPNGKGWRKPYKPSVPTDDYGLRYHHLHGEILNGIVKWSKFDVWAHNSSF